MVNKEKTKVGKFLASIGKPLDAVLDIAADLTGIRALDSIGDAISGSEKLTDDEKEIALAILKAEKADIADARDLQKVALNQEDLFSKRFIYYFSSFWSIIGASLIVGVMFIEIPQSNIRLVDTSFGFLLGTVLASMFTYFFGSSAGSAKKNEFIEKLKNSIK